MTAGRLCLALLLALPLAAARTAPAAAADASVASRWSDLGGRTAKALEAHAAWCTKKRLFGQRDVTFEILLEFEPDHEEARKRLRYERAEDGAWVQDERYKRATNWSRGALPEEAERRAKILAAYRTDALAIFADAKDTAAEIQWALRMLTALMRVAPDEERAPPLLRTLELRLYRFAREHGLVAEMGEAAVKLRSLYPGDVAVRTTLGETKVGERWVLLETARVMEGGARLDEIAKEELEDASRTKKAELRKTEQKIELPWTEGAACDDVRAVGTAPPEVLAHLAACCQAAGPLLEAALDTKPNRRKGLTIYAFGAKGEIDTFLDGYPVVDNPSLQQREKLGLDLVFADGNSMAVRSNPPDAQLDLAVNTVLNQMISDTFLGGASCRGWHAEGISRYLAFKLTGTRLSISVVGRYAGQGGDRHVPESKESWLTRAHGLVNRSQKLGLDLMLGKGVDVFDVRDAVVSYAFAVYLIEGHEGMAARFLESLHASKDVNKTSLEVMGDPLPVLEWRFRTWLEQVLPVVEAPPK